MAITISAFIATSLDGFIATPDGGIEWLEQANALIPRDEDCGYLAFMQTVDTLIVGSNTFRQVLTFSEWPFKNKRVVVLSKNPKALPELLPTEVSISSESPKALVDRLRSEGVSQVYVDGGMTIQSFLRAGLLDTITITVIPLLLGAGKPLFGPLEVPVRLTQVSTTCYPFGFVQTKYRIVTESHASGMTA